MNRNEMIAVIDQELANLAQARELLRKSKSEKLIARLSKAKPAAGARAKRRPLSDEARQKIAAGQKRRWARLRRSLASAATSRQ